MENSFLVSEMFLRNVTEHKWTEENMRMAVQMVQRKTMVYLAAVKTTTYRDLHYFIALRTVKK